MHPAPKSLAAALLCSAAAIAQCPQQWHDCGIAALPDGPIYASTTWDPDGPGPAPDVLVIGGNFGILGRARASNISAWDGQQWQAIGPGVEFPVTALAVHAGRLVAAGLDGPARAALWDGLQWQHTSPPLAAPMSAQSYGGDLYLGGLGQPSALARLRAGAWESLPFAPPVLALGLHEGNLVIGGEGAVSWWDGTSIVRTAPLPGNDVATVFESYQGSLVTGVTSMTNIDYILRWTGESWVPLATGMSTQGFSGGVRTLRALGDALYAGGAFYIPGVAAGLARLQGGSWHPVGGASAPAAMTTFSGELIACGSPVGSGTVAAWNGQSWRSLLPPGASSARALGAVDGALWVQGVPGAGSVARYQHGQWQPLPPLPANSGPAAAIEHDGSAYLGINRYLDAPALLRLDPAGWTTIPIGLPGSSLSLIALRTHQDRIIAAGAFLLPDGPAHIAAWTGASWLRLGDPPGPVFAIQTIGPDLYAAGSSPTAISYLARLDGGTWVTLSTSSQRLTALAAHDGLLIGAFPGLPSSTIASWNGASWSPLGGPLPADIRALASDARGLFAGGTTSWGSAGEARLYRWDGAAWSSIPVERAAEESQVNALVSTGDSLYASGAFLGIDGILSPHLARLGPATPACYANCDNSSAPPALNVADFTCFLRRYAAGCR